MTHVRLSLLRGVCQIPAYAACLKGFFEDEGLRAQFTITPTAWLAPRHLADGECEFAVLPWTRVAVAESGEAPLRVVCGSGYQEAALVVQKALGNHEVRSVAVPREGGMKDLTALGLIDTMGWQGATRLRFPSGDGAIIAFVGQGADAASMVEPYATMFEQMGMGRVARRTGDVWPGAPGCSLACTASLIERDADLVQRVVRGYVRAVAWVNARPDEAAALAEPLIGVKADFITAAIRATPPNVEGIRNHEVMRRILGFMKALGYVRDIPEGFVDLRFLEPAMVDAAG